MIIDYTTNTNFNWNELVVHLAKDYPIPN